MKTKKKSKPPKGRKPHDGAAVATTVARPPERALPAKIAQLPDRLAPTSLEGAMKLATFLSDSDMVPKEYRGKPGSIMIAIAIGHEIGLKWAQALQNISPIGGRPTLWGDAGLGIVMSHPDYEWHKETDDGSTQTATCVIKRRGLDPVVRSFSHADAERIQVWENGRMVPLAERPVWKAGYAKRMRQMRARWWCLKDTFPDALKGVEGREYIEDDVTARNEARVVDSDIAQEPELMPRRLSAAPPPVSEPARAVTMAQPPGSSGTAPPSTPKPAAPSPTPPAETPSGPRSLQPGQVSFELNGQPVVTNGITKPTLLKTYKMGAQLDELTQKGAAKDLLGREFGAEHRAELTEEAGERYVRELVKRVNQALEAHGRPRA